MSRPMNIERYEKENQEFIEKIEQLKIDYKRQHDMEWEARRREEEIQALKKALSDAQMYIFEEREHAMKLQHDNDALRSKFMFFTRALDIVAIGVDSAPNNSLTQSLFMYDFRLCMNRSPRVGRSAED